MASLADRLSGLAAMSSSELREAWNASGTGPCPSLPVGLLRRLLAQQLQEKRRGGRQGKLALLVARELERIAASNIAASNIAASDQAVPVSPRRAVPLTPGTRLIREWNGRTIAVDVTETGFVWEEQRFCSLSEIARAVTGAHWSGPRFFGLKKDIRRG